MNDEIEIALKNMLLVYADALTTHCYDEDGIHLIINDTIEKFEADVDFDMVGPDCTCPRELIPNPQDYVVIGDGTLPIIQDDCEYHNWVKGKVMWKKLKKIK